MRVKLEEVRQACLVRVGVL